MFILVDRAQLCIFESPQSQSFIFIVVLEHWNFQSLDREKPHQRGKPVPGVVAEACSSQQRSHLPHFGEARAKRAEQWAQECKLSEGGASVSISEYHLERRLHRPAQPSATTPRTVADIIGRALDKVGSYGQLSNTEQVCLQFPENILSFTFSEHFCYRTFGRQ